MSFTGNIRIESDANAADAIIGLAGCSSRTASSMAEKSSNDRCVENQRMYRFTRLVRIMAGQWRAVLILLISIIRCSWHRIMRRIVQIIQVVTELRLLFE
jgi:hypothetical protein